MPLFDELADQFDQLVPMFATFGVAAATVSSASARGWHKTCSGASSGFRWPYGVKTILYVLTRVRLSAPSRVKLTGPGRNVAYDVFW